MNQTFTPDDLDREGKQAYDIEDFLAAARAFEAAADGFKDQGDKIKAAEMANNMSVALLQADQPQAALDALGNSVEVFSEEKDYKRQAMAVGNKAAALEALGELKEAEALYWESAKLLETCNEMDLRASVLQSISKLQLRSGRYMEAISSMQSGLDHVEKPNFRQRMLKKLLKVPLNMLDQPKD